jgi:hypothetical protein
MKSFDKKVLYSNNKLKNANIESKRKATDRRHIIYHLIHPDYILFDWEFFSNQLEFE